MVQDDSTATTTESVVHSKSGMKSQITSHCILLQQTHTISDKETTRYKHIRVTATVKARPNAQLIPRDIWCQFFLRPYALPYVMLELLSRHYPSFYYWVLTPQEEPSLHLHQPPTEHIKYRERDEARRRGIIRAASAGQWEQAVLWASELYKADSRSQRRCHVTYDWQQLPWLHTAPQCQQPCPRNLTVN